MKSFRAVLKHILHYWRLLVLNIIANIFSQVFSLVSLTLIIPFLQLLFDKSPLVQSKPQFQMSLDGVVNYFKFYQSQLIINNGKEQALLFICFFVIAIFLVKNFFRYMAAFYITPLKANVVKDLRRKIFSKVLQLPLSFYSEKRKGDLIARMTTDLSEIEFSILNFIESIFRDPVAILLALAWMFYTSAQLTLFVLIMLPLTGLLIGQIGKTLKKQSQQFQNRLGGLISLIEESLGGLRIIKGFNGDTYTEKKFSHDNDELARQQTRMWRRRDISSPLSEVMGIAVVSAVLWFGGRLVLNGESSLSAETFIAFILVFSQLITPAKSVSSSFYNIQKGLAAFDRVQMILDEPLIVTEKENATAIHDFKNEIEYRSVGFKYEDEYALKNLSVKIQKGKMIALVGPSGAGKSTLVDMLPRFYDPQEGAILIDGTNITDLKLKDLRKLMGIVTQESILFNDTIFNNIAYGMTDAKHDDVEAAAKVANAHQFISLLKDGYETVIGDRGSKLSGGERQRITIARAVFKNPPILILDEATSSLDTESERLVQDALQNLMKNRTSLVIAHRLSTIQNADEILVMRKGELIERGKHTELLAHNGVYKKLVDLQMF